MNVFLGICEDNNSDPLKIGRIKVRVFGKHTEIRSGEEDNKSLPTARLPWATPCFPINSQSIDGIGDFQVPANGSVVMVVFLDADEQHPVYFGTLPKIAAGLPDFSQGFSDPNKQHPSKEYVKESPISRLARNENIDKTIVKTKADKLKSNIDANGSKFDEPMSKYGAEYTKNRVIESASGHVIEIDDTPSKERIHIYHKSGSFIELYPDGQMVNRVEGTKTSIIIQDNNILIEGDYNLRVKGKQSVQIDGANNIKVGGNTNLTCSGSVNITAAAGINLDGGSGSLGNIVTTKHTCHFTGSPHGVGSSTVKASK
jgi:hypothetical protein